MKKMLKLETETGILKVDDEGIISVFPKEGEPVILGCLEEFNVEPFAGVRKDFFRITLNVVFQGKIEMD